MTELDVRTYGNQTWTPVRSCAKCGVDIASLKGGAKYCCRGCKEQAAKLRKTARRKEDKALPTVTPVLSKAPMSTPAEPISHTLTVSVPTDKGLMVITGLTIEEVKCLMKS